MKTCTICKKNKELSEFNKNKTRKDGLQTICKECAREKSRKYYNENTEAHKKNIVDRNRIYRDKLREHVLEEFKKGCKDCGNTDSRVLEFDHLPEFKKDCDISRIISASHSIEKLKKEIAKCDVVCSNCHKIRTYDRTSSYRNIKPL